MSHPVNPNDNSQQPTQQNTEGDKNQVIGEVIESTIYHISDTKQITINQAQTQPSLIESIKAQPLIQRSPYLGLRKFEVRDKDLFFGRDQLTSRLLDRLKEAPFLLVLGASGSGKSSLIRAGLIPKLSDMLGTGFRELIVTPDRDPFDSFRSSLRSAGFRQADLESLQTGKPETIVQVVRSLKSADEDWLIFIDQFEELFTLCQSLPKQQAFIDGLFQLMQDKLADVRMVAAMRADFLDRLGAYPQLSGILQWAELITDMGHDELRLAIEKPAAHHGVVLEPELTEEIIHDLKGQPDTVNEAERVSLPLLQYTLKLLWESSEDLSRDRTLRVSTYRSLGGVRGALQRHVDEIYAPLPDEQKQATKYIFLQLVDVTSADAGATAVGKAVSRRAALSEFSPAEQAVLRQLVDAGLLVSDDLETHSGLLSPKTPSSDRKATVELAHETLIDAWDTLKAWIEESRPLIRTKNQLREDAHRWYEIYQTSRAQAEAELWQGRKLQWLLSQKLEIEARFGRLKPEELQFIEACEELCDRTRRREVRRLRQTIAWVSGFLALSSGLAVFAGYQWLQLAQNQIRANSQYSQYLFTLNPNTLDSLIEALKAAEAYQRTPKLFGTAKLEPIVMEALTQSVYWVREKNRMEGHSNAVNSVSFSRDGSILATGSDDGTVRLWSQDGQLLLKPLEGHTDAVTSVSVSPDGTKVASVSRDKTLKLWDIQSGKLLDNVDSAHSDEINSVAFNSDGTLLATASRDHTIQLWTVQNNSLKRASAPFSKHISSVGTVAFSPNGKLLASGSDDGQVILWDLQGNSVRNPISVYQNNPVIEVSFNQDGTFATAGEENGQGIVKLWDATGNLIRELSGDRAAFLSAQFSPDGNLIVASDGAGVIRLWQLDEINPITLKRQNTSRINSIRFSSNGKLVAVGSSDNSVELWNLGSPLRTVLKGHKETILGVAVSSADAKIATSSQDGTVRLWSPQGQQIWETLPLENAIQVTRVKFHPQHNIVVSGDSEGKLHFWNSETGKRSRPPLPAHDKLIYDLEFSPNGQFMVSTSGDKTAKLWNFSYLSTPAILNHESDVYSASFSFKEHILATASADGVIKFWDTTGKSIDNLLVQNDAGVSSIAFSPTDNLLALGDLNGSIKLWDKSNGRLREIGTHKESVWSMSFSFDGQLLATASDDSTIKIWKANGTLLTTLKGHNGNVNSVSFDPQYSHVLVSGGQDARAVRWIVEDPTLQSFWAVGCEHLGDYLRIHSDDSENPKLLEGLCEIE